MFNTPGAGEADERAKQGSDMSNAGMVGEQQDERDKVKQRITYAVRFHEVRELNDMQNLEGRKQREEHITNE